MRAGALRLRRLSLGGWLAVVGDTCCMLPLGLFVHSARAHCEMAPPPLPPSAFCCLLPALTVLPGLLCHNEQPNLQLQAQAGVV
jgi:hypothetical protein